MYVANMMEVVGGIVYRELVVQVVILEQGKSKGLVLVKGELVVEGMYREVILEKE